MSGLWKTLLAGGAALGIGIASPAAPKAPAPPLEETRLTVHTLLREDVFAGFVGDMERLARGEKNIDLLLKQRPDQKASLLAWKASTQLFRAVLAHEGRRPDEFDRRYRSALELFAEAWKLSPQGVEVAAITGGSHVIMADRLPEAKRPAVWSQAYESYQVLWKQQAPFVAQLPVHLRGELLAGLAQTAQRTGRAEEAGQHLDRILALMRDTPYEAPAREWKKDIRVAATGTLACLSCHDSGRLEPRLQGLEKK